MTALRNGTALLRLRDRGRAVPGAGEGEERARLTALHNGTALPQAGDIFGGAGVVPIVIVSPLPCFNCFIDDAVADLVAGLKVLDEKRVVVVGSEEGGRQQVAC